MELRDVDLAAVGEEIGEQQVRIGAQIEHHQRVLSQMMVSERVPAGRELHGVGYQIGNQFTLQLGEGRPPTGGRLAPPSHGRCIGDEVGVDELHRVARQSHVGLIPLVRRAGHRGPALLECRGRVLIEANPRIRRPYAGGERGTHVRRKLLRVDRHARAGPLREDCGRQPQRAAPDDAQVPFARGQGELQREGARSPRQRPAAASVTVVVNHILFPYALDLDPRALCAKRPRADRDPGDAVRAGAKRGEFQTRRRARGRARIAPKRRATGQRTRRQSGTRTDQDVAASNGSWHRGFHDCLRRTYYLRSP